MYEPLTILAAHVPRTCVPEPGDLQLERLKVTGMSQEELILKLCGVLEGPMAILKAFATVQCLSFPELLVKWPQNRY